MDSDTTGKLTLPEFKSVLKLCNGKGYSNKLINFYFSNVQYFRDKIILIPDKKNFSNSFF